MEYWWCAVLFRIFLPCVIVTAVFLRPTITSYIYMVLGCYMPFFSVPTNRTIVGATGFYMKLLMVTCTLSCIMVFSFYFTIFLSPGEQIKLEYCSPAEILIRTLGVTFYGDLPSLDALVWILPEPLMLITSVGLYFGFKKLTTPDRSIDVVVEEARMQLNRKKLLKLMLNLSKYLVSFMLCITAILKPTAFGAIYYVVFLGVLTYWACYNSLGRIYARILVCLIPIMFLHITILYFYQFQYFQESTTITKTSFWGRLFNLVDLKTYKDCADPRLFKLHRQTNVNYALPICLFFLYQLSILVSRQILEAKDGIGNLAVAFFHRQIKKNPISRWKAAIKYVQKKIEKEKVRALDKHLKADWIKMFLDQMYLFIARISHIVANFLMMVWAVAAIGWPGLVLLFISNVIWLVPARRKLMLWMSPFLVVLVVCLLLKTYLYSLDLTREELPSKFGVVDLTSGMYETGEDKSIALLLKSLCGVVIFVAMRQLMQERAMKRRQREQEKFPDIFISEMEIDRKKHSYIETFQKACLRFFAIWWIWIVIIAMVVMEFWSRSSLFRIAFVGLAMLFLASFQLCPFNCWKKFVWVYWWIVLLYAMFNLIVIYMYQFPDTRKFLFLYGSKSDFTQYGFIIWKDKKQASIELAKPLFLQIAIVIQQNYLQKEFNKITSPLTKEELAEEEKSLQQKGPKMRKLITTFNNAKDTFFEVLEVHLMKGILLVGWFMCVHDLCAICAAFVLLYTPAAVFGKRSVHFISYFTSYFVQVLIILRLLYMNQYTEHHKWDFVGYYTKAGERKNVTLNGADWLGFHESALGREYADFNQLKWSFFFISLVTVHRAVTVRMRNYRRSRNLKEQKNPVLFPEITSENCYDSTENLFKYLANYGFYRFGCEISLICISIVMANRMDAFAVLWSIILLIMFPLSRDSMRRLWLPILVFLALLIPIQYINTLGLWPSLFYETKADYWSSSDLLFVVQQFCHIMNMAQPPVKEKITWDFILFFVMSRQWLAFRYEHATKGQDPIVGNNDDVSQLIDDPNVKNPISDFVTYTKNFLDGYKWVLFKTWFYLAIATLFMAGMVTRTIDSFGYLIGAFLFLWEGSDLFLRPPKTILRRWNLLITYNVSVMLVTCISQMVGCLVKHKARLHINCELIQFVMLGCNDRYGILQGVLEEPSDSSCKIDYEHASLFWDSICFFWLIWQQRIFKSYHFFHIVNSAKAQTILADRGAMLINEDMNEKRQKIDNDRITIENNMKRRLEKIKANYDKIEEIRAGNYQLLDQVEKEIDIPLLPPAKDDDEDSEYDPYDPMPVEEYLGLFLSADIKTVNEITEIRGRRKKAYIREQMGKSAKSKTSKMTTDKEASFDDDLSISRITLDILLFSWGLFESCIVSLTMMFNRRTKDFRRIIYEIHKEKRILTEKTDYAKGVRLGVTKFWHPTQSYTNVLEESRRNRGTEKVIQYSIYVKLLRALWYMFLNYSEWLCYLVLIWNQSVECSFITLPLTLMMLCWGSLTVPKPTKTFWVVCIAHLLIMVFVQNFFNMNLTPWTRKSFEDNPLYPPGLVGIYSRSIYLNFILLVPFFLHRIVLQSLGLWKTIDYRTTTVIKDGDYKLIDDKFVPANSNSDKSSQILVVKSVGISMGDYFPECLRHGFEKYAEKFRLYIQQLTSPSMNQIPADVYFPMFLCDLCNLFLLMFFFKYFEPHGDATGLIDYIKSNRVPVAFLVTVLGYMGLMMIDRGLYLRRNRFGKLMYHFCQVCGFHVWFFYVHPILTGSLVRSSSVVQAFYFLKCIYFLFSAYQIRSGYPSLISSHFLWHGYTLVHRIGYHIYRQIPYFLEIRCLQDWIFCDSCLGLPAWFKLEDVTQHLFTQKCKEQHDIKWGHRAGEAQNRWSKYIQGGAIFAILVLAAIFPFLLHSMSAAMGETTRPRNIKIVVYLGGAEPILHAYAPESDVHVFTKEEYKNLSETFNNIEEAEDILQKFDPADVIAVHWSGHSLTSWDISPGSKNELLDELNQNDHFLIRMEIEYTHISHGHEMSTKTFGQSSFIPRGQNIQRQNLINMIKSQNETNTVIQVPLLFPKFLTISKELLPKALPLMESRENVSEHEEMFANEEDDDEDESPHPTRLRNGLLTLRNGRGGQFWWQIKEDCPVDDDDYMYYLKDLPYNTCDGILLYVFNEKTFTGALQYIAKKGILGLYVIYFMVVIRVMKIFMTEIIDFWISNLPNPDKVLRKCMEIYIARDMKNYELERETYEEMIFIMRSREILIKLSRFEDNNYDTMLTIPGSSKK